MKIKYLAIILLAIPLTACDKTYADSYDEGFSDGYEAAKDDAASYVLEHYSIDELYDSEYIREYVTDSFYIDDLYDINVLIDYLEDNGYTVTYDQSRSTEITYVVNKNSQIFHKSNCPNVISMKEKNKEINESRDFFVEKGFIDPRGGKVTDTSSSKATMLFAPSGFAVSISEHLRDRD